MIGISSKYILGCSWCPEDSTIFIPCYCYSWHYNKVWRVNLTWNKPKTDLIEYIDRIIIIWNPTYSLGRVGGSPIALRVGQSEVNWTMRASVSYY